MSSTQQPQKQRDESPPYTTSETNQSLDVYQQMFWQRQMAKVEEQAYLPDELVDNLSAGNLSAGSGSSKNDAAAGGSAAAGPIGGSSNSKDLMDLFKPQAGQLPLARIKKVMKASDDQVKMISAEAPILFAKACEIFIADLTSRAYIHATSNRRRTVQQSDVVAAITGSNQFDFLVDIVPRTAETSKGGSRKGAMTSGEAEADEEMEGEEDADESDERTTD